MMISPSLNPSVNGFSPQYSPDSAPSAKPAPDLPADKVSLSDAAKTARPDLLPLEQRPTAQQSAEVILGFIGQRLQQMQADGASQEQLNAALQDALKGFRQGLQQAMEVIEGFGLMTDELMGQIQATEQQVLAGLEQLQQRYVGSDAAATVPVAAPAADKSSLIQSTAVSYAESYRRSEAVSLEVITNDGDKISLQFDSLTALQRSQSAALISTGADYAAATASSERYSSAFSYSLSIEGNLDQGEREALAELLAQVESLADEFFAGDFESAFQLAMEMEMDFSELAAMSVDMTQTTTASVAATYSDIQQLANSDRERPATAIAMPGPGLAGLGQLASQLLDVMDKIESDFPQPLSLLSDLLANRAAQRSVIENKPVIDTPLQLLESVLKQLS